MTHATVGEGISTVLLLLPENFWCWKDACVVVVAVVVVVVFQWCCFYGGEVFVLH